MEYTNPVLSHEPVQTMIDQSVSKRAWILISVIVAIVFGATGYMFGINSLSMQTKNAIAVPTPITTTMIKPPTPTMHLLGSAPLPITITPVHSDYATPTPDPIMADWKTHTDPAGFSFRYPPEWQLDSLPGDNQDVIVLSFTITKQKSDGEFISPTIQVVKNLQNLNINAPSNATVSQIFQGEVQADGDTGPTQTVIDGYPAIKASNSCDPEEYFVIAPGIQVANAVYTIRFGNIGSLCATAQSSYLPTDPFVQQQLANFRLLVSSLRFPAK